MDSSPALQVQPLVGAVTGAGTGSGTGAVTGAGTGGFTTGSGVGSDSCDSTIQVGTVWKCENQFVIVRWKIRNAWKWMKYNKTITQYAKLSESNRIESFTYGTLLPNGASWKAHGASGSEWCCGSSSSSVESGGRRHRHSMHKTRRSIRPS